ncbi:MAG TPA: LysM peptidoglycan-binding domain-containing protein [Candidatus Parcubacteria bacterium]|nr:LysM peptidoglycan-binding domain-containing protein [Candidatus Parcubacteria bacterium]
MDEGDSPKSKFIHLLQSGLKKIIDKNLKSVSRDRLILLSLISLFVFGSALVVFSADQIVRLGAAKDLRDSRLSADISESFYNKAIISPVKNITAGSPEMSFAQKNTLINVSSPAIITPKVFGIIVGGYEKSGARNEILTYQIEKGDTLYSIAKKFDISLETILWANKLSRDSKIKPGQKLMILPVSGVLYTVKKGDTLSSIASRYKAKIDDIIDFNGLSEEADIYIGDSLIIPGGKMPATIASPQINIPVADSYFIFPCQGVITQGLHYYNAIDVANKCGSPIVAASSGVVQRTGWIRLGGQRVTILHPNGVVTYYGHLSKILVKPGQKVNTGDIIGYMGRTGHATGCHIHFEVIGAKNFLAKYPLGARISWKK